MTSGEMLETPALPLTDQRTLDLLYKTFSLVSQSLEKHGIPFFMIGGTLLGARRHGGVIPWDDDGDLAVELGYFAKVRQWVVPELESLGVGCSFGRMGNLKLFSLEGRPLISEGNICRPRHPKVDIFPFEKIDGRWTFFSPACRERWGGQFFEAGEVEELEKIPFGPLTMPAPSAAACESYLRRTYGDDYSTRAVVAYSHISSRPTAPIEIEITDRSPGLPSADFMAVGHCQQAIRTISLQCKPSQDGHVILDLAGRGGDGRVSEPPQIEMSSEQWREELLAVRCGISEVSSWRFPIKVQCKDVQDVALHTVSGDAALRNYIELIRTFLRAGKELPEWFNINRLPLHTIEAAAFRSLLNSASGEDRLLVGVSAEICSLFKDALEIYQSTQGAASRLADILEWRLRRRLGMPASPPSLRNLSGFERGVFDRERAILDDDSDLEKLGEKFAGTNLCIRSSSYLEERQRAALDPGSFVEELGKMASVGCDESQIQLSIILRGLGNEAAADYWMFQAASSGNPNAIHLWSRRRSAMVGASYIDCMRNAALGGDVTARILLARKAGGGELALYVGSSSEAVEQASSAY